MKQSTDLSDEIHDSIGKYSNLDIRFSAAWIAALVCFTPGVALSSSK